MNLLAAILFVLLGIVAGAILTSRILIWLSNRGWNLLLCHRCYTRMAHENGHWKHFVKAFAHTSCPDCSKVLIFGEGDPVGPPLHTLLDSLEAEQADEIIQKLGARQKALLLHIIEIVNKNHSLWIRTSGRKTRTA